MSDWTVERELMARLVEQSQLWGLVTGMSLGQKKRDLPKFEPVVHPARTQQQQEQKKRERPEMERDPQKIAAFS